jgi:ferrochelatase
VTRTAIVTIAHGTVDDLGDMPAFLTNIRRGHPAPPDVLAEVLRHYEAIGGRSPLNDICRDVATRLEARTAVPVRMAMRLWRPYPQEVLADLAKEGITRVVVLPLAQHSAKVYGDAVREAAKAGGLAMELVSADNWGRTPALTRAFAHEARNALALLPPEARGKTTLLLTAHSLPLAVVRAGDPYETEVRGSAEDVVAALGDPTLHTAVAFQSQGMSSGPGGKPMPWLGPTLHESLDAIAARADTHVVVAPIGFLADHVEILYDLDIDAEREATKRGLVLSRTRSLNASDALIDALVEVLQPLLGAQ